MMRKIHIKRTFLDSFSKPTTFEKPSTIDVLRQGSIASMQENVKRTKIGHGQKQ